MHDPLTAINTQLASRDARPSSSSSSLPSRARARAHPAARGRDGSGGGDGSGFGSGIGSGSGAASESANEGASASAERTSRESAERLRALELIRRKKRETGGGGETPSTVRGGRPTSGAGEEDGYGYGDVFNRSAVEEAHRWDRTQARRGWRDGARDPGRDRDAREDRDSGRVRDRDGRDGGRGRDWDRRGAGGRW